MAHWNLGHINWEQILAHWSALFTNMAKMASNLQWSLLRAVALGLLIWWPNLTVEISHLHSATPLYYLSPSKLRPDQWSSVPLCSRGPSLLRGHRKPGRSSFSPGVQQQRIGPPRESSQAPRSPAPIRTQDWIWRRKTDPVPWQTENYLKETQITTMRLILTQEHRGSECLQWLLSWFTAGVASVHLWVRVRL